MSASGAVDSRCSDSAKFCKIDRTALHSEKDDDSSHTQENQAFLKAKKKKKSVYFNGEVSHLI